MGKTNISELLHGGEGRSSTQKLIIRTFTVIVVLFVFLVSLKVMGHGFKLFGKETASEIINATSNPFVSLFIGMLATALIQSSSTTTTMVVVAVIEGTLGMEAAVPMIMGANIGTSVTSSIVSFAHITKKKEYRKAIAAATVHDFFNILVTVVLFPLEMMFGFLSNIAIFFASFFVTAGEVDETKLFNIMDWTVKPVAKLLGNALGENPWIVVIAGVLLLFFSLRGLTSVLKSLLIGEAKKKVDKVVFKSPLRSLLWGIGLTASVQSSSVTTSLVVPMVASNKLSLKKAFPFLMGANIGTTVTSLIAALSEPGLALSIAFVHLFFNLIGVFIFFPIPTFRNIPLRLARRLGKASLKNRSIGFVYVLVTFFVVPFILIFLTQSKVVLEEYKYVQKDINTGEKTYAYVFAKGLNKDDQKKYEIFSGLENDSIPVTMEPEKYNVYRDQNIIHIGSQFYLVQREGFCWDNEDNYGDRYRLCIEKLAKDYPYMEGLSTDTCLIMSKKYHDMAAKDSTYQMVYLDVNNQLILKTETYNKSGKLIKIDKLVATKP